MTAARLNGNPAVSIGLYLSPGANAVQTSARVRAALDKVGLLGKEKALPVTLSGGEQQRVAVARALLQKPDLVLADEPTGNLDSKTGIEIMELLKDLNQKGATIVVVTHNPEVSDYAKRIITVRDGLISVSKGGKK